MLRVRFFDEKDHFLRMPRKQKKLKCGVGAQCSVYAKYMHPAIDIADRYPNATAKLQLGDLLAIRKEKKIVKKREQVVVVFRHGDFEGKEIYAVERWVRVTTEGPEDHFFELQQQRRTQNNQRSNLEGRDEDAVNLDGGILKMGNRTEDIAQMRASGFDVDDDNDCLPENRPSKDPKNKERDTEQKWGWNGLDQRKNIGAQDHRPGIKGLTANSFLAISYVGLFFMMFKRAFIEDVMLKGMNKRVDLPINLGEFLRWLGIWLLLSTIGGFRRSDFWCSKSIDRRKGAPYRFNDLMSGRRFEEILQNLVFTDEEPPPYKDRFWEARQMVRVWNEWMAENFVPGWINCLDESMSIWTNRWTCPGWVFCPRKPHPFGNEYHTICCCMCGVLYRVEMVEGKDRPDERPVDPIEKNMVKQWRYYFLCVLPYIQQVK